MSTFGSNNNVRESFTVAVYLCVGIVLISFQLEHFMHISLFKYVIEYLLMPIYVSKRVQKLNQGVYFMSPEFISTTYLVSLRLLIKY